MSNKYGPKIVTDGLVLCLDAAAINSYSGSGTAWYDLSGNGYNASLINGPSFSNENAGLLRFDGANDYGQITSSTTLTNITSVSVGCWVKVLSAGTAGNGAAIINRYSNTTSSNGWAMQQEISGGVLVRFRFDGRESSAEYFTNATGFVYNISSWYYVVGTKSGTSWKLYVNGSLEVNNTNGNGTTSFGNNVIYMAAYPQFGNTYRSNIDIALTQVYNRTLSADEIRQNYKATKGRFGL